MKIAYLANSTLISDAANAVHVVRMCAAFAANGHDVTLHAMRGSGSDEDVFRYYGALSRFSIVRHDERAHPLVGPCWRLSESTPLGRLGNWQSLLYGRVALASHFSQHKHDLVFARNLHWLRAIDPALPFVAESHRPPQGAVHRYLEAGLYRRPGFRRLVVISERLRQMYLEIWPWLAGAITVAHDAADPLGEVPPADLGPGRNVGYVGHMYSGRGTEVIREMALRLPGCTFHMVGGRPEDIARFAATSLPPNIRIHGHLPPAQLPPLYAAFDAVLAPYQQKVSVGGNAGDTSAYMSPLKIFEYMSAGKPILCSDLPVLREVLSHGHTALLLPHDQPAAWAEALRTLVDDPAAARRLGAAAQEEFLRSYTWDARARAVLEGLV